MEQGKEHFNIAVLASGSGSNAENLINYFTGHARAKVALVICNNPLAGVLERADRMGVESVLIDRAQWKDGHSIGEILGSYNIDVIVLAGFLWLVPEYLIEKYKGRIVNIHPALLPKYGGKGMYGSFVHEAVRNAGDRTTGITIHEVNNKYDEGRILAQYACEIDPAKETSESIAAKVHALEYKYYPLVIEQLIGKLH